MISIIGGKFKKQKIDVPLKNVRPTTSLKREAIFSILESYSYQNNFELYKNKCFIDLFAGSGSLGLEAISRGATLSYFYEINKDVYKVLKNNCYKFCKKNEFEISLQDSIVFKKKNFGFPISTVFIDPPYNLNPFDKILNNILKNDILNNNSIIVTETNNKNILKFSNKLKIIKEKIYGKTKIIFLKKLW